MAAAFCALLNAKGFEVGTRFMFVTVSTGNHSSVVIALGPYQENYAVAEPTQTLEALFVIAFAFIFHSGPTRQRTGPARKAAQKGTERGPGSGSTEEREPQTPQGSVRVRVGLSSSLSVTSMSNASPLTNMFVIPFKC